MLDSVWKDLKHAVRLFLNKPGFTVIAVASLALGIGANSAIFLLLDAIRLRPLPVPKSEELVELRVENPRGMRGYFDPEHPGLTFAIWEQVRQRQASFSGLAAWSRYRFDIARSGAARYAEGLFVNAGYFHTLAVQPLLGRTFDEADDGSSCAGASAVVSYSFWQSELGGRADAVGRKLTIAGHPFEIIGVIPPTFSGTEVGRTFDIAIPFCADRILGYGPRDSPALWWLSVMGRLKPDCPLAKANAQFRAMSPGLFAATLPPQYPGENVKDYLAFRLKGFPAASGVSGLRDRYSMPLYILLTIATIVLCIACANIAGLMLAQAGAREREFAIRFAFGASRRRILQQLLSEGILLGLLSAYFGSLLATLFSRGLVSLLTTEGDRFFVVVKSDWRVLAFLAVLTVMTSIVSGLVPAMRAIQSTPSDAMKNVARTITPDRRRFRLNRLIVAGEIALSLVLLMAAILFGDTLWRLKHVDVGFQQTGLVIARINFPQIDLAADGRLAFKQDLLNQLRSEPSIEAAADSAFTLGWGNLIHDVWIDGARRTSPVLARFNFVSSSYFSTVKLPFTEGRDFTPHDTPVSPKVAIVNEAFVAALGLQGSATGTRFRRQATPFEPESTFTIVGVVRNAKYYDVHEDNLPVAFLATSQDARWWPAPVIVRSKGSLLATVSAVKRVVNRLTPDATIEFDTYSNIIGNSVLRERLVATLAACFGLVATVLSLIGVYGVVAYLVEERRREIGIRLACGATSRDVLSLVLGEAARMLLVGLSTGSAVAIWGATYVRSMLFQVRPYEPKALLCAIAGLSAAALAGSYLPARRASTLDPMSTIRDE